MSDERPARMLDEKITERIRTMPDATPPTGFAVRVMAGIEPKRPSVWTRFKLWSTRPRSVTFTPVRLVPALAVVVLLIGVGWFSLSGNQPSPPMVRFMLRDPGMQARSVAVIGSFNDWKAEHAHMRFDRKTGVWTVELSLPPGDYEYMFLVDGRTLVPDPEAPLSHDDGFGNRNSILFVNGSHEQAL